MIDLSKKYRTRNGCRVIGLEWNPSKLSGTDIVGYIVNKGNPFIVSRHGWRDDGGWSFISGVEHGYDLVEDT